MTSKLKQWTLPQIYKSKTHASVYWMLGNILRLKGIRFTTDKLIALFDMHHHAPHLDAMIDTLSYWGIQSMMLKLKTEKFKDLPMPLVAHRTNNEKAPLVIITECTDEGIKYLDYDEGEQFATFEESNTWLSGKIVGLAKMDFAGEPNHKFNQEEQRFNRIYHKLAVALIILSLFIFSALGVLNTSEPVIEPLLIGLNLLGALFSMILISHSVAPQAFMKVCAAGNKINCGKVLLSPYAYIFGIPLSDFCLTFFTTFVCFITFIPSSSFESMLTWLWVSCFGATLFCVYSIYLQMFKIKSWCSFCVGISLVIFTQLGALTYFGFDKLQFPDMTSTLLLAGLGLFVFGFTLLARTLFRRYIVKYILSFMYEFDINREETIRTNLKIWPRVEEPNFDARLILGPPNAKYKFYIVASTDCIKCAEAVLNAFNLYERYQERFNFELIFTAERHSDTNRIMLEALEALSTQGIEAAKSILLEWYTKLQLYHVYTYEDWCEEKGISVDQSYEHGEKIFKQHKKWCESQKIPVVPIICFENIMLPSYLELDMVIAKYPYFVEQNANNQLKS